MQSRKNSLNKADYFYIWARAKLFLIPLALIYIAFLIPKIEGDGFQWSDFGLSQFEQGALVLYVLNRLTTTLQLFLSGKKK